jgi:hypothetical protein
MQTKLTPLRAIRAKCLDCSSHKPKEVRECSATSCGIYPVRLGHNPSRKGVGPGSVIKDQQNAIQSLKILQNDVLNEHEGPKDPSLASDVG